MSNDFFNNVTQITRFTVGRAATIMSKFAAVAAGFDKLPSEAQLKEDRTTFASDTGAVDAYAIALPSTITAYNAGLRVVMIAANTNTGACTLNIDGIGARSIKRADQSDPDATDISASDIVELIYDGTNFILTTPYRTYLAGNASNLGGNPNYTGNPEFSGVPQFTGSPDFASAQNKSAIRTALGLGYERGSNANGEYVRFPDGTQICTITNVSCTFIGSNRIAYSWTYPAAFLDGSNVVFSGSAPGVGSEFTDADVTDLGALYWFSSQTTSVDIGFRGAGASPFISTSAVANCRFAAIGRYV